MFSCLQILEAFLWFVLITLLNVTLIILTLSVSRLLNLLLRLVAFLLFLNPQCLASISRWITASSSWKRFCLFVCRALSSIMVRSEERFSRNAETDLVCRLLLEKKEINLVYITGGPRSIMSLIGNSVQFVNHSRMPALEAYRRGADTVMIASSMNQLEHAVMADKSITSVDQLRGKVLGITPLGALTDIILREALRYYGISEKEVTIIPVGDEGARLSSLQTGRWQAVIISGIQRRTAARLGFRQVIDLAKLPIEVSGSSIQVRRAYITQNSDTVMKFLKAWIEAGFLFKAKSQFSLGVLKKYVANPDREELNAID